MERRPAIGDRYLCPASFALLKAGRSFEIDALSWDRGGPLLAGGVIVAAAAYQLTPLKEVCLRHCRGPFRFLLEHWRPGAFGAVRWVAATACGASAAVGH